MQTTDTGQQPSILHSRTSRTIYPFYWNVHDFPCFHWTFLLQDEDDDGDSNFSGDDDDKDDKDDEESGGSSDSSDEGAYREGLSIQREETRVGAGVRRLALICVDLNQLSSERTSNQLTNQVYLSESGVQFGEEDIDVMASGSSD